MKWAQASPRRTPTETPLVRHTRDHDLPCSPTTHSHGLQESVDSQKGYWPPVGEQTGTSNLGYGQGPGASWHMSGRHQGAQAEALIPGDAGQFSASCGGAETHWLLCPCPESLLCARPRGHQAHSQDAAWDTDSDVMTMAIRMVGPVPCQHLTPRPRLPSATRHEAGCHLPV